MNTKQTEALKLALRTLVNPWSAGPDGVVNAITAIREALAEQQPCHSKTGESETQSNLTLTGETQAQQQKPVAYASDVEFDDETEIIPAEQKGKLGTAGLRIPLYIEPLASKPWVGLKWQQAPVKTQWGDDMVVASVAIDKDNTVDLYCERSQTVKVEAMFTSPQPAQPSKPWVGLTDEDVTWLCNTAKSHEQTWGMFVRAVEAKLREKNA